MSCKAASVQLPVCRCRCCTVTEAARLAASGRSAGAVPPGGGLRLRRLSRAGSLARVAAASATQASNQLALRCAVTRTRRLC